MAPEYRGSVSHSISPYTNILGMIIYIPIGPKMITVKADVAAVPAVQSSTRAQAQL